MTWKEALIGLPLALLGGLLMLLTAAGMVLTRTDWGHERLRRFALERVNTGLNGSVEIDAVVGGELLRRMRLSGVRVFDADGDRLASVDTLEIRYRWWDFLTGDVVLPGVTLINPDVRLEQGPDARWDIEKVFAGPARTDTTPDADGSEGMRVTLRDIRIRSGNVELRIPRPPDFVEHVPAESASARTWRAKPTDGGWQQLVQLEQFDAELPLVQVTAGSSLTLDIGEFVGRVGLFREPIELNQLRGGIELRGDSLAFDVFEMQLRESRLFGRGHVVLGDRMDYQIALRGDPLATRDLLWLQPDLPIGIGHLDLTVRTVNRGIAFEVTNAVWRSPEAELRGRLGLRLTRGDELSFQRVELSVERFDPTVLQKLISWESPLTGNVTGRLEMDGPISDLALDTELWFQPAGSEERAHLIAEGGVSVGEELGARDLTVVLDTLPLEVVRGFVPGLALRGTLSGEFEANGRLSEGIEGEFGLRHIDRGRAASVLRGSGSVRKAPGARTVLDLNVETAPLSLTTIADYYPAIPFRGRFSGEMRAVGPLTDLQLEAHLRGVGDSLRFRGGVRLDPESPPRFRGQLRGWRVTLASFRDGLPQSDLDFRVEFEGRGGDLEKFEGTAHADLFSSFIGGVRVDSSFADLRLAEGRVRFDTVRVAGEFGELHASGVLALQSQAVDTLRFDLQGDSIGGFNPWLFPAEAPVTGPGIVVNDAAEQPDGRYGVEGTARLTGSLVGNVRNARMRADFAGRDLEYDVWSADSARVTGIYLAGVGDSLSFGGDLDLRGLANGELALSSVIGHVMFEERVLTTDFAVQAEGNAAISGRLWTAFDEDGTRVGLERATVVLGLTEWRLAGPTRIRLADTGAIEVQSTELVSSAGRIQIEGSVGATGPASFMLSVSGLDMDGVAELWPGIGLAGVMEMRLDLSGRTRAPVLTGEFEINDGRILNAGFASFAGEIGFKEGVLSVDATMRGDTARMFRLYGTLPLDLTLPRPSFSLPERAIQLRVDADRIPLTLAALISDEIDEIRGHAAGAVRIQGTPRDVSVVGQADLAGGAALVRTSGIRYEQLQGELLFRGDLVELREVTFRGAGGGRGTLIGTIRIRDLSRPVFNLRLTAVELPAYNQVDARMTISGTLGLDGPFDEPRVTGDVRVVSAVFYMDELGRRSEIIDPTKEDFLLIDTVFGVERGLAETSGNDFLDNMAMELDLNLERNTWLRSEKANVEIAGRLRLQMQPGQDVPRMDGTLTAVRGDYRYLNKRFEVVEGTVEFVGTPGINPNVYIVARYTVQTRQRPIEIQVVIEGTLEQLTLRLESSGQPTINEADLLSYLLFGRPSYEITRTGGQEGSVLEGVAASVPQAVFGYALESILVGETGIDYVDVSRAPVAGTGGGYSSGLAPALAATQVEVGWYLAPTLFVSVAQQLVGAVGPSVRLEWRLDENLTLEGVTEQRFGGEAVLLPEASGAALERSIGLFLFYGWTY